jgi:hypothetical protein
MKILSFVLLPFFVIAAATIAGCKKNANDTRIVTLSIASTIEYGAPVWPTTNQTYFGVPYMQVTEEETGEAYLLSVSQIEGFDFEEGYAYRIKVSIAPIPHPPADGHSLSYTLIKIISKIKE